MTTSASAPKCVHCEVEVPYSAERCIGCGADVGFPNVRASETSNEVSALHARLRDAQAAAVARSCANELEEFGSAAAESEAVLMRNLTVLSSLVSNEQAAMVGYYKMVRAGARLPQNNEFDEKRAQVDGVINPHHVYEELAFAALSLDGHGVSYYGDYAITLRGSMIATRASVFEENPFQFVDKHTISVTGSVPPGYRATWARRGELAMAKLHPRINAGMSSAEFPAVLVEQGTKSSDSDFIEVHIYGSIHKRAIFRVIGVKPKQRADQLIWKRTKRDLEAIGAIVEEV